MYYHQIKTTGLALEDVDEASPALQIDMHMYGHWNRIQGTRSNILKNL
jgi:hypothetical protein